jgi:hypothetical protein
MVWLRSPQEPCSTKPILVARRCRGNDRDLIERLVRAGCSIGVF